MSASAFTATAITANYTARLKEWDFYWDTTISITHTDKEWFEFRKHSSDIYNKDFDMLKDYCTSNGKPPWYAIQLRQIIELQVILHYFPQMELTKELASFLSKQEKQDYFTKSYMYHKDNLYYAKFYARSIEDKCKQLEKENRDYYGRCCWFKRRCGELEKEVKQLKKQIENIGAREIGRLRAIPQTEPNYGGRV